MPYRNMIVSASNLLGKKIIRKILEEICKHKEITPTNLAEILNITTQSLSRHLGDLKKHKLVKFRRDGTTIFYSINRQGALKHIEKEMKLLLESFSDIEQINKKIQDKSD